MRGRRRPVGSSVAGRADGGRTRNEQADAEEFFRQCSERNPFTFDAEYYRLHLQKILSDMEARSEFAKSLSAVLSAGPDLRGGRGSSMLTAYVWISLIKDSLAGLEGMLRLGLRRRGTYGSLLAALAEKTGRDRGAINGMFLLDLRNILAHHQFSYAFDGDRLAGIRLRVDGADTVWGPESLAAQDRKIRRLRSHLSRLIISAARISGPR